LGVVPIGIGVAKGDRCMAGACWPILDKDCQWRVKVYDFCSIQLHIRMRGCHRCEFSSMSSDARKYARRKTMKLFALCITSAMLMITSLVAAAAPLAITTLSDTR
jgi:hypothetical protein